ncbi:MAG: response regulator [Pirellulaceae bacterium]|nr:response regulator [Planctomycetales bacterium]
MSNDPLSIAIAEDEPLLLQDMAEMLQSLGHRVVGTAKDGQELIEICERHPPDLVITDIKMPNLDGLEAATALREQRAVPIIIVSAHHDRELIDRALENHVLAYLVKPVKEADMVTAIALVQRRFKEFEALRQQADDLRQALEDRKLVERAKGILMKRANLDEQQAFARLHKLSRDRNQKMVEVARMILTAEEAFKPT